MPEYHGCGEEAKKHARKQWLQQTNPNPYSAPLKDRERDQAKNELRKKLSEQANKRKPQANQRGGKKK
jgi:hypothetical protein